MSISRETILSLGNKLAPAAVTFSRLRLMLTEPDTNLEEIVQLIRLDPALTFHVVRMSNSVLFGIRSRIDTLEAAVSRVGFGEIHRLVALSALQQVCQADLGAYRLKAQRLWENAIATAAAAEVLAKRAGREPGLAYTAGLLRTLGRVILDGAARGEIYPGEAEWPSVSEWEQKTFGATSADVTTALLEHWRFPAELTESVRGSISLVASPRASASICPARPATGSSTARNLRSPACPRMISRNAPRALARTTSCSARRRCELRARLGGYSSGGVKPRRITFSAMTRGKRKFSR
jgi:HD-like signal output (HDOD) protein